MDKTNNLQIYYEKSTISQGKHDIINKVKDKMDYHLKFKSEVKNIEETLKVKFLQNKS